MYQITGNEYISLPEINRINGNVNNLTVLHMNSKGILKLEGKPFIRIKINIDNKYISLNNNIDWVRHNYWIPEATYTNDEIKLRIIYLTPKNQKGMAIRVLVENITDHFINVDINIQLSWNNTLHIINESFALDTTIKMKKSKWTDNSVFMQNTVTPLIAIAPIYDGLKKFPLDSKKSFSYDLFLGVGVEEVSAATTAKYLKTIGFDTLFENFNNYLDNKKIELNINKNINKVLNTNLFYSLFYSVGYTFDTEELVLVSSRSSHNNYLASYVDSSFLLYCFPTLLLLDTNLCKKIIKYVFIKQIGRIGEFSRYIDGTLLQPGFKLDSLCAPLIALDYYLNSTEDCEILKESYIKESLELIKLKLLSKKHNDIDLYETYLMPNGEVANEKYLTYDNVLVWKSLNLLSTYFKSDELAIKAKKVKSAISKYLIKDGKFIYSSNLESLYTVKDQIEGSLLLLPYYGFCLKNSKIWIKTTDSIKNYNNGTIEKDEDKLPNSSQTLLIGNIIIALSKTINIDDLNDLLRDLNILNDNANYSGFLSNSIYSWSKFKKDLINIK